LRHQLQVLQRTRPRRVRLAKTDRWLWVVLAHLWTGWRTALVIVKPETVIAWHRQGFRLWWIWKSRRRLGRPTMPADVRTLIRTMAQANPQTWRTFLRNHVGQIVAADFFVVPTVTYRLVFVPVLLAHDRRRIRHVAVTTHPTAAWTAQQLREALPWDEAPRYLIHDRDHAFDSLRSRAKAMAIEDVLTAPRAPCQNAFVERFIGSARRECFDHVIVFREAGLKRLMMRYCSYYEQSRTHLSLNKDAPIPRPIAVPSEGHVVAIPQVGGLRHRYERRGRLTSGPTRRISPTRHRHRRHADTHNGSANVLNARTAVNGDNDDRSRS
jgi:hypothetical protein